MVSRLLGCLVFGFGLLGSEVPVHDHQRAGGGEAERRVEGQKDKMGESSSLPSASREVRKGSGRTRSLPSDLLKPGSPSLFPSLPNGVLLVH